MEKIFQALFLAIIGSAITIPSAVAGSATDALSICLADNTTGKDRKDLARWVWIGMSAHPEIKSLANVPDTKRDELDRLLASMFTRLITEDCRLQAKEAIKKEGNESFEAAFGAFGKLAMKELMTDSSVNASFTRFTKYIDEKKVNSALE